MATISDILNQRKEQQKQEALKAIVTGVNRPNYPDTQPVVVTNPITEVAVNNLDDVLTSLALLGKGIAQGIETLDRLYAEATKPEPEEEPDGPQEIVGVVKTDVSLAQTETHLKELLLALEKIQGELKKLPRETKVEFPKIEIPTSVAVNNLDEIKLKLPKIEIPKTVTVDNFSELKTALKAVNDNIIKLADVVRTSTPTIDIPAVDNGAVIDAVHAVQTAINGIVFPIPPGSTPSFRNNAGEAVSAVLGELGTLPVSESDLAVQVATDSATATITYVGQALPGSATSAAAWKIRKIDETSGAVITWADGNSAFDNVWNNRESLTYA